MDRKSEEKSPSNNNNSGSGREEHSQPLDHNYSDLGAPSQEWEERDTHPREWPRGDYDRFQPRESQIPSSVALGDDQHDQHGGGYASSSGGAMSGDEWAGSASRHYASSTRSVGSTGSQEGERFASYTTSSLRSFGGPPSVGHLSEPRFPSHNVSGALSYAASEAAKSDIATVCSGSVIEDIEVSSMLSAELNPPQTPSSEKAASLSAFAAASGGSRRSSSGGRVEFASLAHYATIQVPGLPLTLYHPDRGSPSLVALNDTITTQHDMGPPLSRAFLLQPPGTGSCPGSVKSFGSKGSDMIAHVDADDCGGSIIESVTDGQSVHSREDTGTPGDVAEAVALSSEISESKAGAEIIEREQVTQVHPLLQNSDGRISPGGTVYKGKGVRRYKGRYMHLPLKRFTQNGVNMESVVRDSLVARPLPTPRAGHSDEYDYRRGSGRGGGWREKRGSSQNGPNGHRGRERRAGEQYAAQKRSRSPSPSRSRSPPPVRGRRSRSRSHSPNRKNSPQRSFRRNGDGSSHSPSRHWKSHGRSKSNWRSGHSEGNAGSPRRGNRRSRRS